MKLTLSSLRPHRALLLVTAVVLILMSALGLTLAFRELPVDVALDVAAPGEAIPVLVHRNSDHAVEMRPTRFTTGVETRAFELIATGEKAPGAQGGEIWVQGFEDPDRIVMDPPGSWTVQGSTLVSTPDKQPSKLSWSGIGNHRLQFTSHPWSGVVELRGNGASERIDLYAPTGGNRFVATPVALPTTRFHAQVARKHLPHVAIKLAGVAPSQLHRLYIGTLIPTVFDALEGERRHWGNTVEGWQPAPEHDVLSLGPISKLDHGLFTPFLVMTILLLLVTGGGALGVWGALAALKAANAVRVQANDSMTRFSWRWWFAFAVPFAVTMTVGWLIYFPGQPSLDTWYQWAQIDQDNINNHHPAFHTLLIKGLRALWDTPASSVLFQLIFLVVVLASAFELLRRMRVPAWALALGYLATLLSPHTVHMAIAVVKDTPYAAAILGLMVMLGTHLYSGREGSNRYWCSVGVMLGLITLFRHNGILVSLGMAVLLPLVFWRERRRSLLALAGGAATLLFAFMVLYPLFGVRPRDFSHTATSYGWHIAALIDQDVPLSREEADFLRQIRPLDEHRWRYTPTSVAVTIWADYPRVKFNFPFADAHLGELRQVHDSLMLRYPGLFVRHLLKANAYLFVPAPPEDLDATIDIQFFIGGASPQLQRMAQFGHPMRSVLPEVRQAASGALLETVQRGPLRSLFWMPAHYLYLAMLGTAVAIFRTRDWRLLLLFLPVLLNTLSLTLGVAQETRFQFPVFLTFGFLCALAALPKRPLQASAGGSKGVPLAATQEEPRPLTGDAAA